jgi:glyoxylase-like metal-dependent hydrolase (beta-lactamase superfamily II)
MAMTYRVTVVKVGQSEVRGPEVYWMSDWDRWYTLFFYIVVIQGNGRTLLINTGPPADLTRLNDLWRQSLGERGVLVRETHEETPTALKTVGVSPEAVDYVLLTPLQAYATANIPLFTRARICVSRRGWIEDVHAPSSGFAHGDRDLCIPDEALRCLLFDRREALRLLEDEDELVPGVRAFWVGAHHRSSMAYIIDTDRGRVAVTDAVFHYGNIESMRPLGINENLDEVFAAYTRLKKEADVVIPLYDPDVLSRFPDGRVA